MIDHEGTITLAIATIRRAVLDARAGATPGRWALQEIAVVHGCGAIDESKG
jgi:hypothetical protein